MKELISIVIPAYNEEPVISELSRRLKKVTKDLSRYFFEFIVVENGSEDNTIKKLIEERRKDKRIKIIQLVKNVGCDGAIFAGLKYATGHAAIIMMADLQDVPELIPEFIKKWEEGYRIVYGIVQKRTKIRFTRKIETFFFYKIIDVLSKGLVPKNASDFRLIDRTVYLTLLKMKEYRKFFRGMVTSTGFKQIGVPFERPQRFAGKSKADFSTVFKVAINGIISFSDIPLRMPFFLLPVIFILFLFSLFGILDNFLLPILIINFIFIFFILGIQGEYIARIIENARDRPQFIIKETYGISTN